MRTREQIADLIFRERRDALLVCFPRRLIPDKCRNHGYKKKPALLICHRFARSLLYETLRFEKYAHNNKFILRTSTQGTSSHLIDFNAILYGVSYIQDNC